MSDSDSDDKPESSVYDLDIDKIRFVGKVNKKTMSELIQKVYNKVKKMPLSSDLNKPTLHLFLSTEGGSLFAAFSALDHLNKIKKHVNLITIADGFLASSGTILLLSGDKRMATVNSALLFHQLSSSTYGKYTDLKDHMSTCDWMMKKIIKMYEKGSKLTKDEIKDLLSKEKVLSIKKCMSMGFIDGIY